MPKIIQINGKVNLIKNHVKIKTVSHGPVAAFFLFFSGIGREKNKDGMIEKLQSQSDSYYIRYKYAEKKGKV